MTINKVLVLILAHPDDESFAFSGLIQRAVSQKYTVLLHTLTQGESSTLRDGLKSTENIKSVRAKELQSVGKLLGLEIIQHDLRDGYLTNDVKNVRELIEKIVDGNQDAVVATTYHKTTSHPDHKVISEIIEEINPANLVFHYRPDRLIVEKPLCFDIKLDKQESETKIKALRCHKSQHDDVEKYLANWTGAEHFYLPNQTKTIQEFTSLCGDSTTPLFRK